MGQLNQYIAGSANEEESERYYLYDEPPIVFDKKEYNA